MFEKNFRTIKTRGITLSEEQIYNSVGDPEFLNDEQAEEMLDSFIKRGEFCLLEAISEEKLYTISLITFEDLWSRNVFALMNWEYYIGFPDLVTLYN
jgi:hypothetical protein